MLGSCYGHAVANIQVKNVPEELHRRLRRSARKRRTTLREVILGAIEREPSHEGFIARLQRRPPVDLGKSAAEFLREARAGRE